MTHSNQAALKIDAMPSAPRKIDLFVSVIATAFGEPEVVSSFITEVSELLSRTYSHYEIVLVEADSEPRTLQTIRALLKQYSCVRLVRLARINDSEMAALAGLDVAIGDYVIVMHPDFDPPAMIPELIEKARSGYDVVTGIDPYRVVPPARRWLRSALHSTAKRVLNVRFISEATGMRVLNRVAVNALTRVRLRKRHFEVVAAGVGLIATEYSYKPMSRSGKNAGLSVYREVRQTLSAIVHNSIVPLRFVSLLGLVGCGAILAYSGYVLTIFLLKRDVMPGWTTLSLQVSGLLFMIFMMLTLIGEYLGRLLDELPSRPLYHVREEESSAVMIPTIHQKNVVMKGVDNE